MDFSIRTIANSGGGVPLIQLNSHCEFVDIERREQTITSRRIFTGRRRLRTSTRPTLGKSYRGNLSDGHSRLWETDSGYLYRFRFSNREFKQIREQFTRLYREFECLPAFRALGSFRRIQLRAERADSIGDVHDFLLQLQRKPASAAWDEECSGPALSTARTPGSVSRRAQ